MQEEYIPRSVMSIHAHPDDQEFSVAGTLAKWAAAGCTAVSVVITSGDAGSNDPAHGPEYKPVLARLREAEQLAANALLGISETIFLHYPDGELQATIPLRRELTRLIRRFQPEVVVTGNMEAAFYGNDYINHPDHRAAAEAAVYAVFPSAGTRLIFPELLVEGYPPHNVKRLYIHGTDVVDTWVDITAQMEIKIAALRKHASQLGEDVEKMVREWDAEAGKPKGMTYAEAFRVMKLVTEETA
jgi:LmbE family N-acetylglucosaminyl deacetylase